MSTVREIAATREDRPRDPCPNCKRAMWQSWWTLRGSVRQVRRLYCPDCGAVRWARARED